jgi:hypothetical protein
MSEMVTIERRAAVEHLLQNRDDMLVFAALARQPMMSMPLATIMPISIYGARWAVLL